MRSENEFESFNLAYLKIIRDVTARGEWVDGVTDPFSIGSDFGKKITRTKELLVYSFVVSNPRQRELTVRNRPINRGYMLANFLWALLGTKSGNYIIPFNSKGKALLDEKNELHAALGPHIFKLRDNVFNELNEVETLLTRDPTSRRAVFQFFKTEDIKINAKDVPCYNHMQFFIREGKLHAHVVMRSQNVLMVLPYDFFFFSLFQEALSVRLGTELGKIYYTANSMHIYEDKLEYARHIQLADENSADNVMKNFSNDTITKLGVFFSGLATAWNEKKQDTVPQLITENPIDDYWDELIRSHFIIPS